MLSFLVLACVIGFVEAAQPRRFTFNILSLVNVYFLLCYVMTPVYFTTLGARDSMLTVRQIESTGDACLWGYIAMVCGWVATARRRDGVRSDARISDEDVLTVANVFFALQLIASVAYVARMGGVRAALSAGALARYGVVDDDVNAAGIALRAMSDVSLSLSLAFAVMIASSDRQTRIAARRSYAIGACLLILVAMANSSRGLLAGVAITHFAIYTALRGLRVSPVLALALFGLAITLFGKQTFYGAALAARGGDFVAGFEEMDEMRRGLQHDVHWGYGFFREFELAIVSLDVAQVDAGRRVEYTFFGDFWYSLWRIVPQRFTLGWIPRPETISLINTRLVTGLDVASIPPGIVAHCQYALGRLGVVAGLFLFGVACATIDEKFKRATTATPLFAVFQVHVSLLLGGFVSNGDPHVYFYDMLAPSFAIGLCVAISWFRRTKTV